MSKELKYLVIHCTATPEGRAVTSKDIRAWHTAPKPKGRGWKQVGYADMIHLDGKIEGLVPYNDDDIVDPWEITNGVSGINSLARHVVYVGGLDKKRKPKDTRTAEQKDMLLTYVQKTIESHPKIKIGGHNQFDKGKPCPSYDVPKWLRENGIDEKNIVVL